MVPTELLAIQHYEHLKNLIERMENVECQPSIALLLGSTPTKQARMIRQVSKYYPIHSPLKYYLITYIVSHSTLETVDFRIFKVETRRW